MPLETLPIALLAAILVTFAAMIFLILHLRDVAALFRRTGEIKPGPGRRTVSNGAIIVALIAFNLGWITSIAIWWSVWSGEANEAVAAEGAPPALMR